MIMMTLGTPNPKTTPMSAVFVVFHVFVMGERTYTCMLIVASPSYERQTVLENGVVATRDPFQILKAPFISQELLKLKLSNFAHKEII